PKPPPNVWIFYSKEEVPKVRAEFPHMNVNEASKIAGQRWKALSNEEKQHYKDMVQKAKEEFEKE
ncbi:high mobility group box domain-containing protein, partial [Sporodiniella umbellata]